MKIKLIYLIFAIPFISCCQSSNKIVSSAQSHDNNVNSRSFTKSDDTKSLEFWTSDTILQTNYPLVQLMDPLYRHVRSDSFPSASLNNEILWMNNYRLQLVSYYDSIHPTSDSLSSLAKADSVISEARALWNIKPDYSTMGEVVSQSAEYTRLMFEQFNEYEKLLTNYNAETEKELLYNEFAEWLKLEQLFSEIYANCVDLSCQGASMAGPMKVDGYIRILQSHVDLYQNEYISPNNDAWKDTGTYIKPAQELLMNCCQQTLDVYNPGESSQFYKDLYQETKELMRELPQHVDSWLEAREQWVDAISGNAFILPAYTRNTSGVLIKLANIISCP